MCLTNDFPPLTQSATCKRGNAIFVWSSVTLSAGAGAKLVASRKVNCKEYSLSAAPVTAPTLKQALESIPLRKTTFEPSTGFPLVSTAGFPVVALRG